MQCNVGINCGRVVFVREGSVFPISAFSYQISNSNLSSYKHHPSGLISNWKSLAAADVGCCSCQLATKRLLPLHLICSDGIGFFFTHFNGCEIKRKKILITNFNDPLFFFRRLIHLKCIRNLLPFKFEPGFF